MLRGRDVIDGASTGSHEPSFVREDGRFSSIDLALVCLEMKSKGLICDQNIDIEIYDCGHNVPQLDEYMKG
ncbi:hypothetical protein GJ496_006904 [Pomphorhynchus laevis]|nr:hypothetical protein GJ496_006904 [Pomphorhynchus laevis]